MMLPYRAFFAFLTLLITDGLGSQSLNSSNPLKPPSQITGNSSVHAPAVGLLAKAAPVLGKTTVVVHDKKEAGKGYKPGAPKYHLQEQMKNAAVTNLHASTPIHVGKTTVVVHDPKEAGSGYKPGSPKYHLQEEIKKVQQV